MSELQSTPSLLSTITSPVENVGTEGGDLPTRILASTIVASLVLLSIPTLGVQYSILKITSLVSAQLGAMFLMMGLFFSRKTHFAGVILIPIPLAIAWLAGSGYHWIAVGVGVAFLGQIMLNLVTRRCGINRLLGINSTCKT